MNDVSEGHWLCPHGSFDPNPNPKLTLTLSHQLDLIPQLKGERGDKVRAPVSDPNHPQNIQPALPFHL